MKLKQGFLVRANKKEFVQELDKSVKEFRLTTVPEKASIFIQESRAERYKEELLKRGRKYVEVCVAYVPRDHKIHY